MAYEVEAAFCCILEICCGGPGKLKAKHKLAKKLNDYVPGINMTEAEAVATYLLDTFDLAPAGTLLPLKQAIAEMVRAYPEYSADGSGN